MTFPDILFSSGRGDWETPIDFFDKVDEVFNFNLDVCASEGNTKVPIYIDEETDGLAITWSHFRIAGQYRLGQTVEDRTRAWMNPPYSNAVDWCKKAYEQWRSYKTTTAVALMAVRTDTRWFQRHGVTAGQILLLNKRLKFGLPCIECGTSAYKMHKPGLDMWGHLAEQDPGLPPSKKFPICGECYSAGLNRLYLPGSNSPTFPVMLIIWTWETIDLRPLQKLGTLWRLDSAGPAGNWYAMPPRGEMLDMITERKT